jgi:ABC-type bacteriocin/lantibiotic exporter with double-glycine peptidase domain
MFVLTLSSIGVPFSLAKPYLTKLIVDKAMIGKDLKAFIIIVLIGGGIFILGELFNRLKDSLGRYIRLRVNLDLNKKVFTHMQNFPLVWFQDKATGEHIYKMDNDINSVTDFITTTAPEALSVFPRLVFTLIIVFYLNWRMALFSLCLVPVLYLPPYYFSQKMRKILEDSIQGSERIFNDLQEIFSHIQLVKVFGKETTSIRIFLKRLISNMRVRIKSVNLEMFSGFTAEIASKIIAGLVTFYGGYQVIKGQMSLGSLTAIMIYLTQLIGLQGQLASFFQSSILGLVSCKRIDEILEEKTKIMEAKGAKNICFQKGEIIFKDVSFGYRPDQHVLKNMSFRIEGLGHIALVGYSGCGKTTLLNLFVRLYDPWEGDILIGGYNIKEFKLRSLKNQVGFVLQEPFLWNDTLENNIRYGNTRAEEKDMLLAAKAAGVDDFVKDLPQGYRTIIGENACKISEGQKQKIAIARALIKEPKILILDEAMSSMDSASEEKIISNIKRTQKELTLITVSHRLSTVMGADLAYYFFRPNEMIVHKPQNLLEYNKEFIHLFTGQDKILA